MVSRRLEMSSSAASSTSFTERTSTMMARMDRDVALQVAFERQTLKPVFHLIGYRLWV
jgi:hypothetical protein